MPEPRPTSQNPGTTDPSREHTERAAASPEARLLPLWAPPSELDRVVIRRALDVIERWDAQVQPWRPGHDAAWRSHIDSIRDLRAALTAAGYLGAKGVDNG